MKRDRLMDVAIFLFLRPFKQYSAISERWDGDYGDNVQWNSIYLGFHIQSDSNPG